MAQTNVTTEQEQIELRAIRRNSSKQIVSYTLGEDENKEYGFHKVPAVRLNYNTAVYNRTMDGISNELINSVDVNPPEIIEQKFVSFNNLYYAQNNQLINVNDALEDEQFKDEFSGRYELTPGAPSRITNHGGPQEVFQNAHYSGYEVFTKRGGGNDTGPSDDDDNITKAYTEGYLIAGGYKSIEWDSVAYGPALERGGYRITQELIDTGLDINIHAIVAYRVRGGQYPSEWEVKTKIARKRPGYSSGSSLKLQISTDRTSFLKHELSYDLSNSNMVVGDLIEIQTEMEGLPLRDNFIRGDRSIFEITLQPPGNTIPWPTGATADPNDEVAPDSTSDAS